jgi:hypothetical protein
MLGLAKRTKARILIASTSEVYGDPEVGITLPPHQATITMARNTIINYLLPRSTRSQRPTGATSTL